MMASCKEHSQDTIAAELAIRADSRASTQQLLYQCRTSVTVVNGLPAPAKNGSPGVCHAATPAHPVLEFVTPMVSIL